MDAPFLTWIWAIATVGGIGLLWFGIAGSRSERAARRHLGHASYGDLALGRPAADRFSSMLPNSLLGFVHRMTPQGFIQDLDRRIARAGLSHRFTADSFLALKMLVAVVVGSIAFFVAVARISVIWLLLAVCVAGLAFFVPDLVIRRRAAAREDEIRRQLADMTDQLVLSVEAGGSFESSIARISSRSDGALQDEWHRVLQDLNLGLSRKEALQALASRTEVAELRELALTIAQSEEHGLSIGSILRVQADEIRNRRRQAAEEAAMKVPVQIVFPLVVCVLPCLMGVILGPAVVRIVQEVQF